MDFTRHYHIIFHDHHIQTTVTTSATAVDRWINDTFHMNRRNLHKLLVGLDTEWRPYRDPNGHQPVAIIQLCVGHRCLIFQLYNACSIPQSLIKFLGNENFTFVGKEVKNDARKLFEDYELCVSRTMDVAHMAASKFNDEEIKRMGLRTLVQRFLKMEMEKPKYVTISNWHYKNLSYDQVQYACIDAFVSFKLGIELSRP